MFFMKLLINSIVFTNKFRGKHDREDFQKVTTPYGESQQHKSTG